MYTADLPKTDVQYDAIVNLREKLVQYWYDVYHLVNLSCENIQDRKYNPTYANCWDGIGLNVNLMPLPNILVVYPPLRYFQNHN